jgi:two-component sensor histidine kinase
MSHNSSDASVACDDNVNHLGLVLVKRHVIQIGKPFRTRREDGASLAGAHQLKLRRHDAFEGTAIAGP